MWPLKFSAVRAVCSYQACVCMKWSDLWNVAVGVIRPDDGRCQLSWFWFRDRSEWICLSADLSMRTSSCDAALLWKLFVYRLCRGKGFIQIFSTSHALYDVPTQTEWSCGFLTVHVPHNTPRVSSPTLSGFQSLIFTLTALSGALGVAVGSGRCWSSVSVCAACGPSHSVFQPHALHYCSGSDCDIMMFPTPLWISLLWFVSSGGWGSVVRCVQ